MSLMLCEVVETCEWRVRRKVMCSSSVVKVLALSAIGAYALSSLLFRNAVEIRSIVVYRGLGGCMLSMLKRSVEVGNWCK